MTGAEREKRARKVARLYASGLSVRQAAKKVHIHHQTALDDLRWLYRHDWGGTERARLDKRHAAAQDRRMLAAVRLRAEGKSLREIAAQLVCSLSDHRQRAKAVGPGTSERGPDGVKKWRAKLAPGGY